MGQLDMNAPQLIQPTMQEIVELGAVDSEFYCRTFFPQTVRQKSPEFHNRLWALAESHHRKINCQVFRGGAKTSILRMYASKRIAYGISRTILILGKSEASAIRTIQWIKQQVIHNKQWNQTFGLVKGDKWQDTEAVIEHQIDGVRIWLLGMGITGSVRGTLPDDFRPDLILLDDVLDDENSATVEQREKLKERIYGAVYQSLAPESEAPDAKMVMLQTPLNKEDASTKALSDSGWASMKFPCWTPETMGLPTHLQQSAWPERWTDEVLRREKEQAIARNQSSTWYREMECKLVAPELASFKKEWLRHYDILPTFGTRVMVIDPVPPPSDNEIAKGLHKKDFEAISVVQRTGKDFYLCEYDMNRGHDPSWSIATMFRLALKYRVQRILVESVAYQRTLAWLMKKAMEQQQIWFVVQEFTDQRAKYQKIVDGLNGIASFGHLLVKKEHTEFIDAFTDYPAVEHDDLIETVALGCTELQSPQYSVTPDGDFTDNVMDESNIPDLVECWGAP